MQHAQSLAHLVKFKDWLRHYFVPVRMCECTTAGAVCFTIRTWTYLFENVR